MNTLIFPSIKLFISLFWISVLASIFLPDLYSPLLPALTNFVSALPLLAPFEPWVQKLPLLVAMTGLVVLVSHAFELFLFRNQVKQTKNSNLDYWMVLPFGLMHILDLRSKS